MRVPKREEVVNIQHQGKPMKAIVTGVQRRRERRDLYDVELLVSGEFSKGDVCYWLDASGKEIQYATIRDVAYGPWVDKPVAKIIVVAKADGD